MKSGIIATDNKLRALIEYLNSFKEFAFDTETDGLSYDRRWIGFSVSVQTAQEYRGWYVPTMHEKGDDLFAIEPKNASPELVRELIKTVFSEGNTVWIHNAKFDLGVLRNEELYNLVKAQVLDTRCVSWLLSPERLGGHGLKNLVLRVLGEKMGEFAQFKFYEKNAHVPVGEMGKYAIDDAVFLLQLAHTLYPQLSEQLQKVFLELETPIMRIVEEMEHWGFRVSTKRLDELYKALMEEATRAEEEFLALFGEAAKISSGQWLSKHLVKREWGVIAPPKKSGQYATDKEALELWASGNVPGTTEVGKKAAKLVVKWRQASKLATTYCRSLSSKADNNDRVHGSYNPWGTGTGRWNSSEPNLQNIPSSRTEAGDFIRKSFVAADGYKLIVADYSQIELRVMAHLSGDSVMKGIYIDNGDIHQMTADACGCERYDAKAINFGLIYKMGAKTLAGKINKTVEEAQEYSDRYFQKYAGVAEHQERLISRCRRKGFTWTITGRRRPLPNINSDKFGLRASDERKAINTQVQGSAADILKIGLRNFHRRLRSEGLTEDCFRIIGQVHDEVVVEVIERLSLYVCQVLQEEMENCVKLSVPLIAEPCIADSWGEAK